MKTKRPFWQIIWITTAAMSLFWYLVKTFVFRYESDTADAFIMMYGLGSLTVYIYFFHNKNEK